MVTAERCARPPRNMRARQVARQKLLRQAETREQEARSHRGAEIERHPGDFSFQRAISWVPISARRCSQAPANLAGRFSRKAFTPSRKSSVALAGAGCGIRDRAAVRRSSQGFPNKRRRMRPSATVGPFASSCASRRVSLMSASSSTTRLTRPQASAVSAGSRSPRSDSSIARGLVRSTAVTARSTRNRAPARCAETPAGRGGARANMRSPMSAMLMPAPAAGR